MKKVFIIFVILVALLIVSDLGVKYIFREPTKSEPVVINGTPVPQLPELDPERVSSGSVLYEKYCASCHGTNLEGEPDWKTPLEDGSFPGPPHDSSGHTWHHPDKLLLEITANGGNTEANSRMPAFQDQLTQGEMVAILEYIKSHWGNEERQFQWWITVTQN
jgi:mono/diheme cytochrome c family protein